MMMMAMMMMMTMMMMTMMMMMMMMMTMMTMMTMIGAKRPPRLGRADGWAVVRGLHLQCAALARQTRSKTSRDGRSSGGAAAAPADPPS